MRKTQNKSKTPRTPKFKVGEVYKYKQKMINTHNNFEIVGTVVEKEEFDVHLDDLLIVEGDVNKMKHWKVNLPLRSDDPSFEYLGTIEDFPEYLL